MCRAAICDPIRILDALDDFFFQRFSQLGRYCINHAKNPSVSNSVHSLSSILTKSNYSTILENLQVTRNYRLNLIEMGNDFTNAFFSIQQKLQYLYSFGCGEGVEDLGFESRLRFSYLCHTLKGDYNNI
jgi:hypothetical protein